jgi:hypothetical protein
VSPLTTFDQASPRQEIPWTPFDPSRGDLPTVLFLALGSCHVCTGSYPTDGTLARYKRSWLEYSRAGFSQGIHRVHSPDKERVRAIPQTYCRPGGNCSFRLRRQRLTYFRRLGPMVPGLTRLMSQPFESLSNKLTPNGLLRTVLTAEPLCDYITSQQPGCTGKRILSMAFTQPKPPTPLSQRHWHTGASITLSSWMRHPVLAFCRQLEECPNTTTLQHRYPHSSDPPFRAL